MEKDIMLKLIKSAFTARENAYAVYSDYKVGAAVLAVDSNSGEEKLFTGCNIENASYGATNCAERTAIFKMVSEGYRVIKAIAVVGGDRENLPYPCGICRQVISEFAESNDIPVIVASSEEDYVIMQFGDLLPHSFSL